MCACLLGEQGPCAFLGLWTKSLRALPTNDRHCNWLQICGELKQTTNTLEKSITRPNCTIAELNMAMLMFAQLHSLIMSETATVGATAQVFLAISRISINAMSWYWSEWLKLMIMVFIVVMLVFVERCLLSSNEWGSDWWCAGCTKIPSYLLHPGHAHYSIMVIITITVIIIIIICVIIICVIIICVTIIMCRLHPDTILSFTPWSCASWDIFHSDIE